MAYSSTHSFWKANQASLLKHSNQPKEYFESHTTNLSYIGQTTWNNIVTRKLLILTVALSQGEDLAFAYVEAD